VTSVVTIALMVLIARVALCNRDVVFDSCIKLVYCLVADAIF
jgi:hypothetical protein